MTTQRIVKPTVNPRMRKPRKPVAKKQTEFHIVPFGGIWAVKKNSSDKALFMHKKKERVIRETHKIANKEKTEPKIVIHNIDNSIAKKYNASDDDSCFITTAMVHHFKMKDDCEVMETLRAFRKKLIREGGRGNFLVKTYEEIAPVIVQKLKTETLGARTEYWYGVIKFHVEKSVEFINQKMYATAIQMYQNCIEKLCIEFKIKLTIKK